MKTKTHIFKSEERTGTCTVSESERIVVKFDFTKYGELGDEEHLCDWLCEIREPYLSDNRPMIFENDLFDETEAATDDRIANLSSALLILLDNLDISVTGSQRWRNLAAVGLLIAAGT